MATGRYEKLRSVRCTLQSNDEAEVVHVMGAQNLKLKLKEEVILNNFHDSDIAGIA